MGTIAIFEECRARGVLEDGIFLCPQFVGRRSARRLSNMVAEPCFDLQLIMAIMMLLYAHKRFHYDRRPLADAIWLIVKRGVSLLANLARTCASSLRRPFGLLKRRLTERIWPTKSNLPSAGSSTKSS